MSEDGYPAVNMVWRCPYCERPTPTSYRCKNWDCGQDLAGEKLERIR